ncbi:MAG: single-stranded-DNA-specific exonuclease RecJ [Armatimonadota bacterium]|jgi:single-stranded-DNA-specific exonuclease
MNQRWIITDYDAQAAVTLAEEASVAPIVAAVLLSRGICTAEQVREFLKPSLNDLHDPFLLPDMEIAAERLVKAINAGEKICVHGDYDCDGLTGAALLVRTLRSLKANVAYRLPHRKNEGYDLKAGVVQEQAEDGVKLIITCDCGICATEAVDCAVGLGVDIIVSDHHEPGNTLPAATAVVNPKRADSQYPFRELAGVGVAFKLAQAAVRKLGYKEESFRDRFMDLVAIGTVADVVPLIGENRIFVKYGLLSIPKSQKIGLKKLLRATNLTGKPITSYDIGFVLGPRINAMGRMDDATKALQLLVAGSDEEDLAQALVQEMETHNQKRRLDQNNIVKEAAEQIEAKDLNNTRVLVLAGEDWSTGLVGLAAGNIVGMYGRPTILLNIDRKSGTARGSGRSVEEFDLLKALRECDGVLEQCGGHSMAAGLSLPVDNIEEFDRRINAYAETVLSMDQLVPCVLIDSELDPTHIDYSLAKTLEAMEPFGAGNPEPVFISRSMRVVTKKRVGNGTHLQLTVVSTDGRKLPCIGFGFGDRYDVVELGSVVDLCYSIQLNHFNGTESVQLAIKAIQ